MFYRKKHVKSRIQRAMPKKSIFKKMWFWLSILFLFVIFSGTYFLIFYSGIQLKDTIIFGNYNIKTQDLQKIVSDDSNTGLINFLNVKINSKSIFLINREKINKDILKKFPEIEKVEISKNFPQTLILNIAERKAIGAFCPLPDPNSDCFLIDGNGIIFELLTGYPLNIPIVRQMTGDSRSKKLSYEKLAIHRFTAKR
jgi:cell division septal protein FtsQ